MEPNVPGAFVGPLLGVDDRKSHEVAFLVSLLILVLLVVVIYYLSVMVVMNNRYQYQGPSVRPLEDQTVVEHFV